MDLIALVLALIALFGWRTARQQLDAMRKRLEASEAGVEELQREVAALRRGAGPVQTSPDLPAEPEREAPRQAEMAHVPPEDAPDAIPDWAAGQSVPPIASATGGDARPGTSLEERLGTRWAVWVGGLALGLGGLLLVRYSIEQGLFGPGARIVLGALFAAALIAAGEWFRRTEARLPVETIPTAHIPSVLTAAGTVAAFGTIYAAHALYDFIGPALTFVLLGVVGIGTMLAAALHGPALAGLGLAGAYVAPMLVSSDKPNPWPVVIYLGGRRGFGLRAGALAALAVAGSSRGGRCLPVGLCPFLGQMAPGDGDWTLAGYAHVLIQLALAALFIAHRAALGRPR